MGDFFILHFMTPAEELFHEIAAQIPDCKEGRMFGALCVKHPNGKASFMYWKGLMVFKLEGKDQQSALEFDGVHVFEPMQGRQMKGWIAVPYDYAKQWPKMAKQAAEYVSKLPAK